MLMSWRHSGFNVFSGPRIQPGEEEAMENLARYIIRASFSQERMPYMPEESKVVYQIEGRQRGKDLRCLRVDRCHVLPCPEQARANGQALWLLQQRGARQAEKERPGRADTLYFGTGWIVQRIPGKLGQIDPKDI